MSTATAGRAREHRVRRLLEQAGYEVSRAAASKGAWDLVAFGHGVLLLVQVKPSAGRVDPEPWNRLYDLAGRLPGIAVPLVAAVRQGVGVDWWELTGRKDNRGRQPWQPWQFTAAA